jgi:hypothetical protein
MSTTYVPLLRWKRGERAALSALSPSGKSSVRPFVLLGADNFRDKKATKSASAVSAPAVFASEVLAAWGPSTFFLDASPLPLSAGGAHPLAAIGAALASTGATMVPATSLLASTPYSQAVAAVRASTNSGVCLRISLAEMTSAATWIGSWPFSLAETDLLVDIGDSADSVLALGSAVNSAFATLASGAAWRSVTLAGTSIPENFTGLAAGLYTRPRNEAVLWNQIRTAGLPYTLGYGDYATVSTATPAPGIAWGYPITVKYTLANDFLVCRGVRTKGIGSKDLATQLRGHAKSIKGYPGCGPLGYCWADNTIDDIATGRREPSGLEFWVRISVNRHIELVRSVLP